MDELVLRDYQEEAFASIRAGLVDGHIRQVLYAPTGAGKTVIAAWMIQRAQLLNKSAAFVVDRVNLVDQTSTVFWEYGIEHGILQGERTHLPGRPIVICSAQTLERRSSWIDGTRKWDLIVVDECHIQRKGILKRVVESGIPTIGLSATPLTKGLGKTFSNIVNVTTTNTLIKDGWLSPIFAVVTQEVNTRGIKVVAGEWQASQLGERVRAIIGDVVETYVEQTKKHFGGPVKTVVFSADVADGKRLTEAFCELGLKFEQVSYLDTQEEQRAKIERHRTGETMGLVSCSVLQRGYDVPDILCMVDAHPYRKSLSSVIQQYGRGMRKAPGKQYVLLLDFSGNYLGFEDAILDVYENGISSLDEAEKRDSKGRQKKKRKPCQACGTVIPRGAEQCPGCGKKITRSSDVLRKSGKAVDVGFLSSEDPIAEKDQAWAELVAIAFEGKRDEESARRFCQAQYRNLFGEFRRQKFSWDAANRATGDLAFRRQIKKRLARYAIQRKKGEEKKKQATGLLKNIRQANGGNGLRQTRF